MSSSSSSSSSLAVESKVGWSRSNQYLKRLRLVVEYKLVASHAPASIFVLPSTQSDSTWSGCMFLRHGVFRGAAFRFLIRFGSAFPRAAPQVQFVAPVPFHPCVNADTGVVSFKFDDKLGAGAWSPETHFVFELLVALKRAFCALDDINALSHQVASNHEACALLARDRDEFVRRARLSVDAANEAIDLSVKQNGIDINVDVDVDVDDNDNDNKEVVDSTTTTTTVSNPADEFSLQFTPFDQRHEAFWTELQSNGGKSSRSPMSAAVRSFIRSIFD